MAIRKINSRSILDGAVSAADFSGSLTNLAVTGTSVLSSLSASISATATDVFVYDTSKDSDGGLWRKRTKETSWYNETLNTAIRGSRQEFPAVAVIVATATTVTIYDADDTALSMWMVIPSGGIIDWTTSTHTRQVVTAANGQVIVATEDGLMIFGFVKDYVDVAYNGSYLINSDRTIVGRANTVSYISAPSDRIPMLTYNCFCVSSAVMPNSYVDPMTGLPNPTIAIGHNTGITIIRDDRTSILSSADTYKVWKISINSDRSVYVAIGNSSDSNWMYGCKKDFSTIYGLGYGTYSNWDYFYHYLGGIGSLNTSGFVDYNYTSALPQGTSQGGNGITLNAENRDKPSAGMVAYITKDYNTGWIPGNQKLVTLASNVAETITGSGELITNGTFDTTTTGWTVSSASEGSIAVSGGQLVLTNANLPDPPVYAYQMITTVVGKTYSVSAQFIGGTNPNFALIVSTDNTFGSWIKNSATTVTGNTITHTWTATQTSYGILLRVNANQTGTTIVDNVTCRLAEPDRSVLNNGMEVYGTLTKSAVATGSDVMAYSGWSGSNFLYEPANSNYDPGSTEFTVAFWVKSDFTTTTGQYIIHRGTADATESVRVSINSAYLYFDYGNSQCYVTVATPPSNVWVHIVCTVRAGTLGRVYVNGVPQTILNGAPAPATFLTGSDYAMSVGNSWVYNSPLLGSMALLRYSLTAVSPEQASKMYDDEKVLFQAGAKANLYGTSNAVAAMAFDNETKLLHVGTPSGRSVFQGLRRVDNTTTAVTTAISAVNGMVAEQ